MARVTYEPDHDGVRELARSAGVAAASLGAARSLAASARAADPRGDYEAQPATVPAGWYNEPRAGARVVETKRGDGARDRTLARLASRGRG